jgi:hypothetical protein
VNTPKDNPAGRLHYVLTEIRSVPGATNIEKALAKAFEVAETEPAATLHQHVAVMAAWPDQAIEQIKTLDDINQDLALGWTARIQPAMAWVGRWAQAVENMQNEYGEVDLYSLAVTADHLHRRLPEPVIPKDKLPELVELVREIIDAVLADTQLPEVARAFLVSRLHEVEQAVLHFRVTGYAGIETAMDCLVGYIARMPATQTATTQTWVGRLWGRIQLTLVGVSLIANTVETTDNAIEAGRKLLGQ